MTKLKYTGEKDGFTAMPVLIPGERGRDLSFKRGVPKDVEEIESNYLLKEHGEVFEVVTDEPVPVVEEEIVEAPVEEISVEEEPKEEAEVTKEEVEEVEKVFEEINAEETPEEPKSTIGKIVLKRAGV